MQLKKLICAVLSLALLTSALGCGAATGAATNDTTRTAETGNEAQAEENTAGSADASDTAAAEAAPAEAEPATGLTIAEDEIPEQDISVTWEDSHIYDELTLGRYYTAATYGVKGYEDVPFLKVSEYLEYLCEGRQRISIEGGVMKIAMNGTEAVIDPAADTLVIENTAKFLSTGAFDGAVVEQTEYNVITASTKNAPVQTEAVPLTVDFKEYHMPVVAYGDDILMPFLALQNTFGCSRMSTNLAYNGKDYYDVQAANSFCQNQKDQAPVKASPYMQAIYSGPFSTKAKTTQAYADYAYYAVCLLLDLSFGHKEEKNITTFDEYFTRMNAKDAMCSTDPMSAVLAEFLLFNYLFDSGHDTLFTMDTVFGKMEQPDEDKINEIVDEIKESEEGKALFEDPAATAQQTQEAINDAVLGAMLEKGFKVPEVVPLYVWSLFLEGIKPEDYGKRRLDYVGDTAVIYFKSFDDDTYYRDPSYYLDPISEEDSETSTFAFFYNCFEDIKQHEEVKNVVINLADNGGGSAAALVCVLGFLSEDGEMRLTDRDLLARNYREECYHVDTNLDGIADDQDGFGGQYEFYIMCTGSSYSCGNALPYFAQKEGLAKVIGTKPGGGDCVLASFVDAYGHTGFYSGYLKLGMETDGVFVSDEKATDLDLNMAETIFDVISAPWFDAEGIADAVHQYQNGATVYKYDEQAQAAKISEFLRALFERLAAAQEQGQEQGETQPQQ